MLAHGQGNGSQQPYVLSWRHHQQTLVLTQAESEEHKNKTYTT